METSNFVAQENEKLQLDFAFDDVLVADAYQTTQPAETGAVAAIEPTQQAGGNPVSAPADESAAPTSPTSGGNGLPAVTVGRTAPEEEKRTTEPQQPTSQEGAKRSSTQANDASQNRPTLFRKRKRKEPLASAAARVYRAMVEQAAGLQTPPNPPKGYWDLEISYSELGKQTSVCKRNMQRVMHELKKTGKVKVEQEPTFKKRGIYRIFAKTQTTGQVHP